MSEDSIAKKKESVTQLIAENHRLHIELNKANALAADRLIALQRKEVELIERRRALSTAPKVFDYRHFNDPKEDND